jgi:eukaryotic-like serine/threonine-protein kinase
MDLLRLKELFLRGYELAPEDQAAFIAAECADDVALADELQRMLRRSTVSDSELPAVGTPASVRPSVRSPVAPAMTLRKGDDLAQYQILDSLGAGAMGEVYRAKDTRLEREVAVKVLPEHFASDAERLERFEREAKVLASLNHPNVAQIFDVDEFVGTHFIVLELVPGESLAQRLERGPLPYDDTVEIARQIAEGLEAAHEAGVIHRDLKPANVMITPAGKVKLLDFGLAKSLREDVGETSSTDSAFLSEPGRVLGTPTYMAPEQARGRPTDRRVDIWAFGCVLYECLTSRRPFPGRTIVDVLSAVVHEEPALQELPELTPSHVRELIRRCLVKDPFQRVRDIGDVRLALERDESEAVMPLRARRGLFALIAVLGLLVGASTAIALVGDGPVESGFSSSRCINFRTEAIFRAAFTSDGRTVVYSAASHGNTPELFVARPENPAPQPVGLRGVQLLAVSSKDELAVLVRARFIAHKVFIGTLARTPLGGGSPREILENVRDADWSSDGGQLAIIRRVDGKDRLEFPIDNVLAESAGYLSDLRVSPAGDRIAYLEHPARWDDRGSVRVVDLQGNTQILSDGYVGEQGLAWAPDGREIFFSASFGGTDLHVRAVTLDGETRIAFQDPGGFTIHDINGNGHWLATRDSRTVGLMIRTPQMKMDREFPWLGYQYKGVLSQDGSVLGFSEHAAALGPNYAACTRKTDGSPLVQLGEGTVADLSRDGKWLLSVVFSKPPKLMIYPTGPGGSVQLERGNIELYGEGGQWFRDGTRVLFSGSAHGQGSRHYVQEVRGGMPQAVTPEGASGGRLSPDERSILARGASGKYFIYPIAGGEPRPALGLTGRDRLVHWREDGKAALVYQDSKIPCPLESVDLETGERTLFREFAPSDLTGLIRIVPGFVTDDEESYVYRFTRLTSRLFLTR